MNYIPLDKLADKLGKEIDQVVRAIKISTFNGVIRDTRVKTGRLRGNWQTTTGQPAKEQIERLDKSGAKATKEVRENVKADTFDWLTNNLPYAAYWEGHDGMIDKNVARLQRTIKEAIDD